MGPGGDQFVQDGHDVAIRVLDDVKAQLTLTLNQLAQIGADHLAEQAWAEEWTGVQAIVRAQGQAVKPAVLPERIALGQHGVHPALCLVQRLLAMVVHPCAPLQHLFAIGDRVCRISVHHDKVAIARKIPNAINQAECLV